MYSTRVGVLVSPLQELDSETVTEGGLRELVSLKVKYRQREELWCSDAPINLLFIYVLFLLIDWFVNRTGRLSIFHD